MKTTTIISSAALALSTFTTAAPTPSASLSQQSQRREAETQSMPSSEKREASPNNEPIVVRTDNVDEKYVPNPPANTTQPETNGCENSFVKKDTTSTEETDAPDTCVIM